MKSDLSFLQEKVCDDPVFQTAWRMAVQQVHVAAQADLDRKSAPRKKAIRAEAERTFRAAMWIRDEIDRGAFAGLFPVDDIVKAYGFHQDDVQTVRRFLHGLLQHTLHQSHQAAEQIPTIIPKSANNMAGYFVGRLCAQFGLGVPTDYASSAHLGESIAIRLMRGLLIDSRADSKPSKATLRRGMKYSKIGFTEFPERKTQA